MASNVPTVAVITRTKDRPVFLERAIKSVHNQTFRDFVHVIINDAGDPAPVDALIEKYADMIDGRVKVIHNTESNGMEAATNKAVQASSSTYIAVHDDDDSWHRDFLEVSVAALTSMDVNGVVVKTDKVIEEVTGNKIKELSRSTWMPDVKVISLYKQCIENQMTPITFMYTRGAYDALGGYDETLPVLGDWDFGIRFLQKYHVEFIDPGHALAYYHHRKFVKNSKHNNSFGEGQDKHRYWTNILMNRYLREELEAGKLGVGYIMSKLRYDQHEKAVLVSKLLPGFVVKRLKRRVQD